MQPQSLIVTLRLYAIYILDNTRARWPAWVLTGSRLRFGYCGRQAAISPGSCGKFAREHFLGVVALDLLRGDVNASRVGGYSDSEIARNRRSRGTARDVAGGSPS